jgi:pantoate--beta-alanine ligase
MSLILSSKAQLEQALSPYWKQGATIGFVPTMGALHAGHCSLMHAAKAVNEVVVLSIFVNPRQFNDSADFDKYPRTLTADIACAETEGVDFIYLPSYDELFSSHSVASEVQLNGLDLSMEGASRPGHFRGVVEVVYALFDHVNPSNAYFGQKDFQQLAIIRAMVSSLKLTVSIVSCPTLRETDGLAMSSRNLRLSQSERQEALVLYKALSFVRDYWQPSRKVANDTKKYGKLSIDICNEWLIWRLVVSKVATLEEIRSTYSLGDVLKLNAILDMREDVTEFQRIDAEKASKR